MATKSLASHGSPIEGWPSGHLPSSGSLLGFLVEAYSLRHDSEYLRGSTAQRWFRGEAVSARSRERVTKEIARAMRADFGESTLLGSEELLRSATTTWDGVRNTTASMSELLESTGGPWAIPVLIIRGFVVASIHGCLSAVPNPPPPPPTFGVGPFLRRLQGEGAKRLSRDELARAVGCSRNTVDAWLDKGVLPTAENIRRLARTFGGHLNRCEQRLAAEIRRRAGRARVGERLLELVRRRHRAVGEDGCSVTGDSARSRTADRVDGRDPWAA